METKFFPSSTISEGNTTPLDLSVRRLSIDRSYRERSASISSSVSSDLQRMNMESLHDGKENMMMNSSNSVSPEQIVCAPSLPGSPPLTPSPKRSSCSPRGILALSPSSLASSLHLNHSASAQAASTILRPLLVNDLTARLAESNSVSVAAAAQHLLDGHNFEIALNIATNASNVSLPLSKTTSPTAATAITATVAKKTPVIGGPAALPLVQQPQIFVKQGVSKCKECNIVFCKYENYLAHKKHYCSARNTEENTDGKPKLSPPTSPLAPANATANAAGAVHGAYQQLICAACGIKFTSLDNLQAHQMYYCPKRIEVPAVCIFSLCLSRCRNVSFTRFFLNSIQFLRYRWWRISASNVKVPMTHRNLVRPIKAFTNVQFVMWLVQIQLNLVSIWKRMPVWRHSDAQSVDTKGTRYGKFPIQKVGLPFRVSLMSYENNVQLFFQWNAHSHSDAFR